MDIKKKISKIFKSKVATAGIGYTIGNLLIKGIAFLSTPIFSRMMTTTQYGIVSGYIAYETYLVIAIGVLFYNSVKSAKYELNEDFDKYISNLVCLIWINTLVAGIIAYLIKDVLTNLTGFPFAIIVLLLLNAAGTSIIYIYNAYMSLKYEYKKYISIALFNAIGNFAVSILLMKTICFSNLEVGRILGYGLPVICIEIYITVFFIKKSMPVFKKELIKYAYRYCIPLIPYGLADATLGQFSRLVIKQLSGNAGLGIYSLAYSVYSIIGVVRLSLDNVWGPWFFEKYSEKDYQSIKVRSAQYMWGLTGFTLFIMLISPEIVRILGDKSYFEAIYSVIPLVAASFFVFMLSIPIQTEYFHGRTSVISFGMVIVAVLNICMTYVFVSLAGYVAAAFCTLFSYILLSIYHFVVASKLTGKFIFDKKSVLGSSITVLVFVVFNYFIIENWILRYSIVIALSVFTILLIKKNIN